MKRVDGAFDGDAPPFALLGANPMAPATLVEPGSHTVEHRRSRHDS